MKKSVKTIIQIGLLLLALVTFTAWQTSNASEADNALQRVKQRGELIMVTSPDYPPYEFQVNKNGKSRIVGMDIDVAKKVAKDLHVKLVIKSMNFDSCWSQFRLVKRIWLLGGLTQQLLDDRVLISQKFITLVVKVS